MKKIVLFLFLASAMTTSLQAQDTVELWDVRDLENCYIPTEWPKFPDDFAYDDNLKQYTVLLQFWKQNRRQEAEWGYRILTDDTLVVYGLAAIMCPGNTMDLWLGLDLPNDTTSQYSDTWLMLFAAEPDSLRQLVDTSYTYVDGWQTPEHYVKFGWGRSVGVVGAWPPLPLYERYFPLPVTVTDSFYVGYVVPKHATPMSDISFPFVIVDDFNSSVHTDTVGFFQRVHWKDSYFDYWAANWHYNVHAEHPLLFPIIAPPDTTVNPDDPLSVQQADLVYRYTAVAPNPATGRVKVTSSFGISSLEAYDAQGRKVHEFRAEGCEHLETSRYCSESIPNSEFSINLDVSSWLRGTYLLRIQTPAGPTTKKLLVQ